jgi:hypothetical protein
MSPTDTNNILYPFPFPTKQPVPPRYQGLPDSATFARLASRPDRIDPEALEFFKSWFANTNVSYKRKDGRFTLREEFIPIGAVEFLRENDFADVTSGSSSTTVATKK